MRYPPEYKKQTREKILEAAGRLFREKGYNGVGVDAVMSEAGLTAGGFYAHFESKEALFAEALASISSLSEQQTRQPTPSDINGLIKGYLSRWHRENVSKGCPLPSLAPDAFRGNEEVRRNFEQILLSFLEKIEKQLPDDSEFPSEIAMALVGQLVGGLMLSRAVNNRELSDKILKACRQAALGVASEFLEDKEQEGSCRVEVGKAEE